MEFWNKERRAEQVSAKKYDEDRFARIQKRLFSDDVGVQAFALFQENSDNPLCCRQCRSCGKRCKTTTSMIKHEGNEECKQRVCKNNGTIYTPPPAPRCDVCNREFCSKTVLTNHFQTAVHKRNVRIQKHGPEVFNCGVCTKQFLSKKTYKAHLKSKMHLDNLILINLGRLRLDGDKRTYYCEACDKSFETKKSFTQHIHRPSHLKRADRRPNQ